MLQWPHSGVHGHDAVWVPEDDRAVARRLVRVRIELNASDLLAPPGHDDGQHDGAGPQGQAAFHHRRGGRVGDQCADHDRADGDVLQPAEPSPPWPSAVRTRPFRPPRPAAPSPSPGIRPSGRSGLPTGPRSFRPNRLPRGPVRALCARPLGRRAEVGAGGTGPWSALNFGAGSARPQESRRTAKPRPPGPFELSRWGDGCTPRRRVLFPLVVRVERHSREGDTTKVMRKSPRGSNRR